MKALRYALFSLALFALPAMAQDQDQTDSRATTFTAGIAR